MRFLHDITDLWNEFQMMKTDQVEQRFKTFGTISSKYFSIFLLQEKKVSV